MTHFRRLLSKEDRLRLPGLDFKIICEDGEVMVHSLILYVNCETWRDFVAGCTAKEVRMDFSAELMEEAMTWIYSDVAKSINPAADDRDSYQCNCLRIVIPHRLYRVFDFLGADRLTNPINYCGNDDVPCYDHECFLKNRSIRNTVVAWISGKHPEVHPKLLPYLDEFYINGVVGMFYDYFYGRSSGSELRAISTPGLGKVVELIMENDYGLQDSEAYATITSPDRSLPLKITRKVLEFCKYRPDDEVIEHIVPHLAIVGLESTEQTRRYGIPDGIHAQIMSEIRNMKLGVTEFTFEFVDFFLPELIVTRDEKSGYNIELSPEDEVSVREYMKLHNSVIGVVWNEDQIPMRRNKDGDYEYISYSEN